MPARNPDPRTTDDKFVMEVRVNENSQFSGDELQAMIKETGIIEIEERELQGS